MGLFMPIKNMTMSKLKVHSDEQNVGQGTKNMFMKEQDNPTILGQGTPSFRARTCYLHHRTRSLTGITLRL